MKVRRSILIASLAACALTTALADNPYSSIVTRNAFGLNPEPPPPPPAPVEVAPPAPTPTIKLTGITSITKPPKALLEIQEPGNREIIKPPPLAAGTSMNGVDVLEINVETSEVRIRTGGLETNLTFEVATLKPATPPSPAKGAAAAAAALRNAAKTRSGRTLPTPRARPTQPDRTPGYRPTLPPPTASTYGGSNSRVSVSGGQTALPSRTVRSSSLTREEALKLLQLQNSVRPPPLPPVQ